MTTNIEKQKGSIALTTVLVLSVILLLAGITLAITTIDLNVVTRNFYNATVAKNQSRACLEESLYKITRNPAYTGSFSINYTNGSCSTAVTNDINPAIKMVSISSTIGSNTVVITKKVDTSASPFSITNP